MKEPAFGAETLKIIRNLYQKGITRYVALLRHSERHYEKSENDEFMELTERGKQTSFDFGKALPPDALVRFFSSPIHRCVDTSTLVEKGLISIGGKTKSNTILNQLFVFYLKNPEKVMPLVYDLLREGEHSMFLRNWFDGKIPLDWMADSGDSAQKLLNTLLGVVQGPVAVGNVCISHDWNLYLIKEYYLGLRAEEVINIDYLEGVIIYEWGGKYYITHHQSGAKLLNQP